MPPSARHRARVVAAAGHEQADAIACRHCSVVLPDELAAVEDANAIREREDLIELGGNEEYRGALDPPSYPGTLYVIRSSAVSVMLAATFALAATFCEASTSASVSSAPQSPSSAIAPVVS